MIILHTSKGDWDVRFINAHKSRTTGPAGAQTMSAAVYYMSTMCQHSVRHTGPRTEAVSALENFTSWGGQHRDTTRVTSNQGNGSRKRGVSPAWWDQEDLVQRIPELNLEGSIGMKQEK